MKTVIHDIKTGAVPITSVSGGTVLPDVSISSVRLWVPNVSFVGQGETALMFVGGLGENAPYFDPESRPQSNGWPVQWNGAHLEIQDLNNLNQLRAVSSVSGAFMAWFGVD